MFGTHSSPDFPLTLVSKEAEISQASDVAAANEHVHRFFEAVLKGGYVLEINSQVVFGERPEEIDLAYRLFLASPKINQDECRKQAQTFFRGGKIHLTAA